MNQELRYDSMFINMFIIVVIIIGIAGLIPPIFAAKRILKRRRERQAHRHGIAEE